MKALHIAIALVCVVYSTHAQTNWNWIRQSITNRYFTGVTYGNGSFVACGYPELGPLDGVVYVSTNSLHWSPVTTPVARAWSDVAYGAGAFVMVGGNAILRSVDGVNWTEASAGTTSSLTGVAFTPAGFFALGESGTILKSATGLVWQQVLSPTTNRLNAACACGGTVVIVGESGTVLRDVGGTGFERIATDPSYDLRGITWHRGVWLAVGITDPAERSVILYSTNATDWVEVSGQEYYKLFAVAANEDYYMAVGYDVLVSRDGRQWWKIGSEFFDRYHAIVPQGAKFVLAGTYYFEDGALAIFKLPPVLSIKSLPDAVLVATPADGLGFSYQFLDSHDLMSFRPLEPVVVGTGSVVQMVVPKTNYMRYFQVLETKK